ncbi:hypothetical protein CDZ96_07250 [Mameliella alba]|nr:hypothetical protein A9320_02145 [Ruegeria sp. PBVC088]OWV49233.1 hypothetical protein CDZ96_07250 [Mameliella alba]OWV59216.1 hypothetical protein CDZ98_12995 [Mameliella alba]
MLGAMLISLVVTLALYVGLAWALMWASRRWLHVWVSIGLAVLAAGSLVQNIISGLIHCSQPPTFVPPELGSGGEGQMVFNCDAPGGMIDRFYLYFLGPVAVAAIIWLAWRFWARRDLLSPREAR